MPCSLSLEQVKNAVDRAIEMLRINDYELLGIDAHECSIEHRLAVYLEHEFQGWNVDCEYNRNMDDPKTLQLTSVHATDQDGEVKPVRPDIIIHRRQTRENLLVIEIKKSNDDTLNDAAKLKAFTRLGEYGYSHGLLLIVNGNSPPTMSWYQNGETIG